MKNTIAEEATQPPQPAAERGKRAFSRATWLTPAGEAWLREHPLPPVEPKAPRWLIRDPALAARFRAWIERA